MAFIKGVFVCAKITNILIWARRFGESYQNPEVKQLEQNALQERTVRHHVVVSVCEV